MKRTYYFPTVNGKPVNFSNNGSILYCGRYCPLRPVPNLAIIRRRIRELKKDSFLWSYGYMRIEIEEGDCECYQCPAFFKVKK
jgi:hypothetical protein